MSRQPSAISLLNLMASTVCDKPTDQTAEHSLDIHKGGLSS